jgi:hemoglobin/transferrin/lactoferrin receptor protein
MKIKSINILFILLSITVSLFGQKSEDTLRINKIQEIEVTANRVSEKKSEFSQQIKLITKNDIGLLQSQTSADLIQFSGAAFVQKSQQGGGSPVLRGFEANRILLVVDGVRMNNLIYRSGHLQNIITTDNLAMEKVEVIYGPSSNVYGSDALGGVIHLYTKNPALASDNQKINFNLNLLSRYGNVNNEFTQHLDFNLGFKKFGIWTSFTYSDFGDLVMGKNSNPFYPKHFGLREYYADTKDNIDKKEKNSNKYIQKFSGYKQYDYVQKILFQPFTYAKHLLNFQFSNSGNIPRYDRLSEFSGSNPRFAEWYYGPQTRMMLAYDFQFSKSNYVYDFIRILSNYQFIEESRHTRRFNNPVRKSQIEQVNVFGFNVDAQKKWSKHHLQYGLDIQLNKAESKAHFTNIHTLMQSPADTRYPDGGNIMNMGAIYLSHKWFIDENRLMITEGFRVGKSFLNSKFTDTVFFKFPFREASQNMLTYSGNFGVIHRNKDLKISYLISSGFRVPNVDDMGKVFDTRPGAVIIPNPDLKPEKALNQDFSIQYIFDKQSYFSINFFYTQIFDAIVTDKFQYLGNDSIFYEGVKSQVFANQNKMKAYIYGYSTELLIASGNSLTLNAGLNYTFGRIKTDSSDYPLDHIPPLFGKISFGYQPSKKISLQFFSLFNGPKKIFEYNLFGEDNFQYATPSGTPAWITFNFRFQWNIHKYLSLLTGVDNILDTQYRVFASGINGPGRNIFASLKLMIL